MGVDEHPEHQAHPEGGGGADLGHIHEAIEEEEGPGLGGYRGEPQATRREAPTWAGA